MLRRKILKILSVLVAVVIVFSCFCMSFFTVGASSVYTLSINQPRTGQFSGYIEYLVQDTDGSILPFVSFWHITGSFVNDNTYFGFPKVDVTVSQNRILLSAIFSSGSTGDEFNFSLNGGSVNGYNSSTYWSYGSRGSNYVDANAYIGEGTIIGYKIYGNFAKNSSSISPGSLSWEILYTETSVLYETLLSLASSISGSNSAIIENATENADKIIDNQNENNDKIIANENKNTDKILNGGSDNPHYSSVDNSATVDYKSKEEEVNNKTASARSSTVSFFNNFGALLNDTPVQRGLLAVSKIMTEIFSIGWLAGIINFALAIGAFAFILGSVIMVVGKISSNESRSTRSEYYKSKTAYYNSRRKK